MSHEYYREIQSQIRSKLREGDDNVTLTMHKRIAELFVDFLYDYDPDMPPRPIAKVLGPLLGDSMMNDKLRRLDSLADALGPIAIRLDAVVEYLEERRLQAEDSRRQK